ncbi:hypothetical protein [Actinoplanes xinjiangensis]|uniref:hypothetical protein n=1 Tax=Actinoplanes xinjiangensis TaxID=512350 RepID=UPI00341C81A5
MTEKLPDLPQAYEPSPVPLDDPSPVPPDDLSPAAPRRRGRTAAVVVAVLLMAAVAWAVLSPGPGRKTAPTAATPVERASATTPSVQRLEALPASAERPRRVDTEGAPTSIYFANDIDEKVTVNRLDGDGQRIRYSELEPGQGYHQQTHAGHVWVIATADGAAVAVFRAVEAPGLAEIR